MIDIFHPSRTALLKKWKKVSDFAGISPWTTDSELAWLAEVVSQTNGGVVGEIGSYKGKSACAMGLGSPSRIVCIDRFQDNTGPEFISNTNRFINGPSLTLLALESAEGAMECIKDGIRFDLFFIDGSHMKEDVVRDIAIWTTLINPGGLLCGHDCFPDDPDNGIHQALSESIPNYHLAIDSIWATRIL
jgi:predicted O-methyltransferase YrrM